MNDIATMSADDDPHARAESSTAHQDDNEIPIIHHIVNQSAGQPRNTYKLEFPVVLLFFAWNMSGTVFQNQILYQICTNTLFYNDSTCDALINDANSDAVFSILHFFLFHINSITILQLHIIFRKSRMNWM